MVAAAVFRVTGTEGVEGNVHASRAWKGNEQRADAFARFPATFPGTTKQ